MKVVNFTGLCVSCISTWTQFALILRILLQIPIYALELLNYKGTVSLFQQVMVQN